MTSFAVLSSSLRCFLLRGSDVMHRTSLGDVVWRRWKVRDVAATVGWKYVTPPDIQSLEYTGDRQSFQLPHLSQPQLNVEPAADELALADDATSRVLSLQFAREPELRRFVIRETVKFVQRHQFDWHSLEAQIARDTVILRRQLQLLSGEKHRYDKRLKGSAGSTRIRRHKLLEQLRSVDYRRFEWLLRKLDITFRPQLPDGMKPARTRKSGIRYMVQQYVENVKQRKLAELRAQFDAEKPEFEAEKRRLINWIAEEEKALGLPLSVDEERGELLEKRLPKRFVVPPRRAYSEYEGMPSMESMRK